MSTEGWRFSLRNNERTRMVFRAWAAFAALVLLSLNVAHAAVLNQRDRDFDAFMAMSAGAGKHTVGFSKSGVPLVTNGVPGAQAGSAVGNMTLHGNANGGLELKGQAKLPLPGGKSVPLNVKAPVTAASAAAAAAGFMRFMGGPIGAGMAAFALLDELGVFAEWSPETQANTFYRRVEDDGCRYALVNNGVYPYMTIEEAWMAWASAWPAVQFVGADNWGNPVCKGRAWGKVGPSHPLQGYSCTGTDPGNCTGPLVHSQTVESITRVPMSEAQLAAAIQAHVYDQAAADALAATVAAAARANRPLTVGDAVVEPSQAVVPGGTQTTTETASDGSSKTKTQTSSFTISCIAGVCTVGEILTENAVATNPDGSTKTSVVTSQKDETDSKSNCDAGNKSAGCAELDTPEEAIPKVTRTIGYEAQNLGLGSGACPSAFVWHDMLGNHAIDLSPYCNVLSTIVKPFVIAFSLLAAFFIILPRAD